jgi:hypothetical protein
VVKKKKHQFVEVSSVECCSTIQVRRAKLITSIHSSSGQTQENSQYLTAIAMATPGPGLDFDIVNSKENIVSLKRKLKKNWIEHKSSFSSHWLGLTLEQREEHVRRAVPSIVQSENDRYCIKNGVKVYENKYDRYLLLSPQLTVECLCYNAYLLTLFDESVSDSFLCHSSMEKAVLLRQLYRANRYPFPVEKRDQVNDEIVLKKDQCIVTVISQKRGDWDETSDFGDKLHVSDPDKILHGSGEAEVGEQPINLYEHGAFLLPFEFDEILENTGVYMGTLAALLDGYLDEVVHVHLLVL